MAVIGLDHVSILVSDAEKAYAFYHKVLGLTTLPRPNLGFPGYWLDLNDGRSLHLMQLPNPYSGAEKPAHGGRDMHFALRVDDLAWHAEQLEQLQIPFTRSKSGRKALFFRDLDGNAVELFEP
ncbi:glyoxylase I family protein [Sulfurivirga caldicuralii]|uniref:Glyoxylase I family protein n=1 Tax=Sulfurivirga caldicuralii TaxID=364032 RepID=A0A1N6EVR4_9GAMM|nr:VOC family protein [Sulfurivirga caldicuralii]SIN87041.1 glyoxylase I family protein [Sulfurivirga caldicuralii]